MGEVFLVGAAGCLLLQQALDYSRSPDIAMFLACVRVDAPLNLARS